jgi:serine/threonine-protein kinase
MLTGEKPYTGEHLTTVVYKIVAEEAPAARRLNPSISQQIESNLRRALAKKPEQRYRTCTEFVEAMEKACAASPGWKTMMRGGSLDLPTVSETPAPASTVLPPARARRTADTTSTSRRSGFLPFLMAILVAAGLLALIGWQAAPWLSRRAAAPAPIEDPKPPAPPPAPSMEAAARPPEAQSGESASGPADDAPADAAPPSQPEPPEAGQKPSALAPPETGAEAETAPRRTPSLPRTAPVSIATSPAGAVATLDNRDSCKTPCSLDTTPGRHSLSISLPGHQMERREIVVGRNGEELPLISLRPAGGTVMLTSSPAGAAVIIDGKRSQYVTPAQISLPPGTHSIAIDKDGRQSGRNVEIRNGAISYLKITLD